MSWQFSIDTEGELALCIASYAITRPDLVATE